MAKNKWITPKKKQFDEEKMRKFSRTHKREAEESLLDNYAITNKKNEEKQDRDQSDRYFINFEDEVKNAEEIIQQFMDESLYSEASKQIKRVNRIKQNIRRERIRATSAEHSREKILIRNAHEAEMLGFKRAWNQLFYRVRVQEREKKEEINRINAIDREYCHRQIIRRCRSAKPSSKMSQIRELEHLQRGLRKRGRTQQLRKISLQKQKLKKECEKQLEKTYSRIIKQQQTKYKQRHTKRYHSFIQRINENKKDHEKLYKRQQQRLKQKFKNVMKNLEHDQAIEMNNVKLGILV